MIRINLLQVERKTAKRVITLPAAHKLTFACSAILVVAAVFVGWRYWTLLQQSKRLDQDIANAQQETMRLHAIIQNVQQFEQQKTQLQQRVVLIEQLRKGQTGPVHMLDQISRALPPMVWLTELKQTDDSVVIDGRGVAVTGVTDFVSNLEASGYFKKSIDIVSSQTEQQAKEAVELIKFSIKAQFQPPAEALAPKRTDQRGGAN
jgi:type IV pilus assembly protein PilN